jgi:hypothetical protein
VDVVAVNSSSLEQGKDHLAGMGRVQEEAYAETAEALGWETSSVAHRIVALHHHLAFTEELEAVEEYRTGFGIAIDATRIVRRAARHGVHLALHGHKHRSFIWRVHAYEAPDEVHERWDLGALNIVGGGSSGSTHTADSRNYFSLIRHAPDAVIVEMYRAKPEDGFIRATTWQAPVTYDAAGLPRLGSWAKMP